MLALALTLLLQDPAPVPSPALVEETVVAVETALAGEDEDAIARALEAAGEVPAKEVVRAIVRALRAEPRETRSAALQALRWNEHPDALDALHDAFTKDRKLAKDAELRAAVVKAIGQHADPKSLKLLERGIYDEGNRDGEHAVIAGRILALGRIRTNASVETLLGLMKKTSRPRVDAHMREFRMSLMVLTGTDVGPDPDAWQDWWREHGPDFEISPERPRLPREELRRWINHWGLDEDYGRVKRREDRGKERR